MIHTVDFLTTGILYYSSLQERQLGKQSLLGRRDCNAAARTATAWWRTWCGSEYINRGDEHGGRGDSAIPTCG
jgi:hypothetical protein